MQETWVRFLGWEDPLEEGIATRSSIPAWRIPMDRGAWQATGHGVAESQTQLKRLSSSSSIHGLPSLVAQLVKNLPAMQKTLVWLLGQEDPLEKGMTIHSSILGLPWWLR